MTYTRSSKTKSPAASAAAVQVPAHVKKQADKPEKNGKRAQVAKPIVVPEVHTVTPVKQASAATYATPKTTESIDTTIIKADAADKKASGASGRRKLARASGDKVSSTIKKQHRTAASGEKVDATVKSPSSKPSRAQTPMKRVQGGAKTAGAKDRK